MAFLRALRWLLRRPSLRVSAKEAIEIARKDNDRDGKAGAFYGYEVHEHLDYWEVRVTFPFSGPLAGRYEIDGQTGEILDRQVHVM